MFSPAITKQEVDKIFETYQEPPFENSQLDEVVENYLALVNQLQNDLNGLRDELSYHKKIHGEITDSLGEFFTIQRLSSIITEKLEYHRIVENLTEIAQKVLPHNRSEVFLFQRDELQAISPEPDDDLSKIAKNMQEEGILEWLWEQANPIVVPIQDFAFPDELQLQEGNLVIAPMLQGQAGMGIYIVHTEKKQEKFSFRDLELLNILVQQAAIAMQYTRLYKKLEKTHEALKNSQTRLMQTIKLATVGELAGGIAHEINNPLQIILGNVQMALMGLKPEESLKVVETQAMRIANIVRGLLSMARQNTKSQNEYLEINSLITATLGMVRGQIEKRGIELRLNLAEKLPLVHGSSIYFQQILLNFILHSKKQIGQNGIISICSKMVDEDLIEIELTDSGVRMPEEYVRKIFDPFGDIDNSSEMNLGLTVSVQMIQDIGGTVQIDSPKGEGNRIVIKIPKYTQKENTLHRSEKTNGVSTVNEAVVPSV